MKIQVTNYRLPIFLIMAMLFLVQTVEAQTIINQNGDFEDGTNGWTLDGSDNATFEIVGDPSDSLNQVLKITLGDITDLNAWTVQVYQVSELSIGKDYSFSARVRGEQDATLQLDGGNGAQLWGHPITGGEWQTLETGTFTTDTVESRQYAIHFSHENNTEGDVFYLDDFSLIEAEEKEPTELPAKISIAEALNKPDGEIVSLKGVVTRAKGTFIYIQQDTAAIRIYDDDGDIFNAVQSGEIAMGDSLEYTGSLGDLNGLKSLSHHLYFHVSSRENELPTPVELNFDELISKGYYYQSELVRVNNLSIEVGTAFDYLSSYQASQYDHHETIELYIPGVNESEVIGMFIPDEFNYEGIIGFYDPDGDNSGAQLRPINYEDIIIIEESSFSYEVGEIINQNGSLEFSGYGDFNDGDENWFINSTDYSYTEIVDESQDEDGKAIRIDFGQFDGNPEEDWNVEVVNEPLYVIEGDIYEATVWIKADSEGRAANAYFGLTENDNFERPYQEEIEFDDEWTKYSFLYEATEQDAAYGMRFGIAFNRKANEYSEIYVDNLQIRKTDKTVPNEISGEIISIAEARNRAVGDSITIQGIVTRAMGRSSVIQDDLSALHIFSETGPYFDAVAGDEVRMGDSLIISGQLSEFNGLLQLSNISEYNVIARDQNLPEAQQITLEQVGEEYESELVYITDLSLWSNTQTEFQNNSNYYLTPDSSVIFRIQVQMDTELGEQMVPEQFDYIGVVGQFSLTGMDGYQLVPYYLDDILHHTQSWNFNMEPISGFIDDTLFISLELVENNLPIEAFELSINYDDSKFDIELPDQTGTLAEHFLLEENETIPGVIHISGASTDFIQGEGDLLNFKITPTAGGEGYIEISDIQINEVDYGQSVNGSFNIIERLCGDVTNDRSVSTLDATFVLRHTVYLSPQYPLTGLDSLAADVTANGRISALDASKVLQYEVGMIDYLSCEPSAKKAAPQLVNAGWELDAKDDNSYLITVDLSSAEFDIYSTEMTLDLPSEISFEGIQNLPKGWSKMTNRVDDKLHLSLFGFKSMEDKTLQLSLKSDEQPENAYISGDIMVNESERSKLSELSVREVPTEFALEQNYPNPFNPTTNIKYSVPFKSDVQLRVFNMLGQKVAELINENQKAGSYTVKWDASSLSSGVYIYRFSASGNTFTKKMLLVK